MPLAFVDSIASKLAFFPPDPRSYDVLHHQDGERELYIQPRDKNYPKVLEARVARIKTHPVKRIGGGGTEIVTAFIPFWQPGHPACRDQQQRARATLLYSHGNAVDLGQMMGMYRELSRVLAVNVFAYDYSGYGESTGIPSVRNSLADISAALQELHNLHGVPQEDVVLYGQSVGSGPTVWLAAQATTKVAGVVLHAPLLSGVRVLNPTIRCWPSILDIFPNHQLATKVPMPALVMHGTLDEVIDVSCGRRLAGLLPGAVEPLWAEGYGHQDLELCREYLPCLARFLASLFPGVYTAPAVPSSTRQPSEQPPAVRQHPVTNASRS